MEDRPGEEQTLPVKKIFFYIFLTDVTDDKRMNQNSWTHLNRVELQAPGLLPEGESEGFKFAPATKTTANTRFHQALFL